MQYDEKEREATTVQTTKACLKIFFVVELFCTPSTEDWFQ
jgi:hypothetical protein